MEFNTSCLGGCTPPQIVNINIPINDLSKLKIYNDCDCEYDYNSLQFAYSLDNLCWSCYMGYNEALTNLIEIQQDYFIRIKISGNIGKITYDENIFTDYSTELEGCFQFTATENSSTYNPYANTDGAIALNQQLAESVSQLTGIPCYYIKLNPDVNSKDMTFKEYTLFGVEAIKQLKIIIADNQMPSSKPEFNDWGIDFQTDWETEITKGSFATAFGPTAQPMEGDLIYIPMMKRMWMVNGAYEEKKDAFMWIATTFKLSLVKYQEKDSVILGDAQSFVDSVVKNKYEDLFGEDSQSTLDSGEASTSAPLYAANRLYPIFESDATRKYITCDSLDIRKNEVYYKGTLISDYKYEFLRNDVQSQISYQKKYCGDELSISFIIFPTLVSGYTGTIISIGDIKININQSIKESVLTLNKDRSIQVKLNNGNWNFVVFKWSKSLNLIDASVYQYVHNDKIPIYKLQNYHYWFDIDNPVSTASGKFNIELNVVERKEVQINNFYGSISNFKLFDLYNDNISELLQMYPTHQHLLINDTARLIVGLTGNPT